MTYDPSDTISMNESLSTSDREGLLQRPIQQNDDIMGRVSPIIESVKSRGDRALIELTAKFDKVALRSPVVRAPFDVPELPQKVRAAIDLAFENIFKFHTAQLDQCPTLHVETQPGVVCSRFSRPIGRVGLYVPGGTAVLPSTALMLGVPAMVAGCPEMVIASPPTKKGNVVPEVLYVAQKIGASAVVLVGGAQAVAAMAYGTETVPKVDKIFGPGNQYVTAAKMIVQNDHSSLVSIDMPAGPSELLIICDQRSNPVFIASGLLSQVVLLAADCTPAYIAEIAKEIDRQARALPRCEIVRQSIKNSYCIAMSSIAEAMSFSNDYAPEHLILHLDDAQSYVPLVQNAGSVFVGKWSPESCGDYASGTNHVLPTYGYARMYSGVNTTSFVKHITTQSLTREGLNVIGDAVMTLAEVEGLEAHRNAVALRINDIRAA